MTPAFLQNELVRAFCWTLIHSLWQGLILAAFTGLVLMLTKRSHAQKRYGWLSMLFFLFLVVTAITFAREISMAKPAGGLPVSSDQLLQQALTADATIQTQATNLSVTKQGFVQRFVDYFNTHSAMVVTIWFIIFLAKLVKLSGNLFYIQRLRSYRTQAAPGEWKKKVKLLADKLGIGIQIQLLESAIVKIPVTMGVLKPVILLPVGLLAQLPADEIEAILLHELAHIKRRDYFVNLLQSLAETIFFFNPALLWLSSMIRDERENCCDDIAIAVTNNKTNFINALISFQEYHFAKPPYGMAFPGKKQQLLNRVKRIVSNRNKTLNIAEKSVLGFGLALLLVFSFVTAQQTPVQPIGKAKKSDEVKHESRVALDAIKEEPAKEVVLMEVPLGVWPSKDTVPVDATLAAKAVDAVGALDPIKADNARVSAKLELAQDTIQDNFSNFSTTIDDDGVTRTMLLQATARDGKKYTLKKVNNSLEALSIDGKQVASADFGNYKNEIEQLEAAYRYRVGRSKQRRETEMRKRDELRETREHALGLKMQKLKQDRVLDDEKRQMLLEIKKRKLDEHMREHKERILRDYDSTRKQRVDRSIALEQKQKLSEQIRVEHKKEMQEHIDKQEEHQVEVLKKKMLFAKSDSLRKLASLNRIGPDRKGELMRTMRDDEATGVKESAAVMRSIINDLEKENIKIDTEKSWFALDNNKFIVDGRDLTKELHEKFKNKYIRGGWGYYYGRVQVSGRGFFLDNKDVPSK